MLKSYKTEINPTQEQIQKINKTIGTCRFIYNFYIAHNKELYNKGEKFMTAKSFSVWLNNEFLPNNPNYSWIKEVSSKSVKKSMENAYTAFNKFFKKQSKFPRFKKKNKSDVKMYFVKNNPIDTSDTEKPQLNDFGLGIDLGVKEFAVISNGTVKKNINKTAKLKKIEKQLKREQRCLSRKYEGLKKRNNKMKGEATRQNIQKQVLKVQKLHQRIDNIRTDYINKCVNEIVKIKPSYITIEDLNVKGMMKNKHLSKAVASQKFYEFRTKLEAKCKELGIELRIVDRWYPSSKLCHECGCINKDLKLSDREYICECGYHADRDYNASLNLRDAISYKIA